MRLHNAWFWFGLSILAGLPFVSVAHGAAVYFAGAELGATSEAAATGTTQGVVASPVKSGGYSFQTNPATTATGYFELRLPGATGSTSSSLPNTTDCYVSFHFRYATKPSANDEEIFILRNTGNTANKISLRLNSSGNLVSYDTSTALIATGATALSANTWYHIKIKAGNGAAYAYEVLLNGASELSGTADLGATNCGFVTIGKGTDRNGNTVDFFFDNLFIDDAAHPGGEPEVVIMTPNANGSTHQFTSGTNASDYQEVDEIPTDADTTYIKNPGVAGDLSYMNFISAATAGVQNTILGLKFTYRCREDPSATSSFISIIRSNFSDSNSSGANLSASYATYTKPISATDHATGVAWTSGGLDAVEAGVYEGNGVVTRCTQLLLHIASYTATTNFSAIQWRRREGY